MFELMDSVGDQAVIKVIGIGGGGGNAVEHMVEEHIEGVEFINANTDAQTLNRSQATTILQLGSNLTKGLGAGADPDIGRQAAMEDRDRIAESLTGADMVFLTAGMGGGTGTGAAPIIAQISRELGILTVAVVTKPFSFEGKNRMAIAEKGIDELNGNVDSLITIPNDRVLEVMGQQATLLEAFAKANDVLLNAVQGISELITCPGLINVDFADVRATMSQMGMAMMGSATATGEERAIEATRAAVSSPLLEDVNISGARGILVNVTAGMDMQIGEFSEVGDMVRQIASDDANVIIGTVLDQDMHGEMRVTLVATGIGSTRKTTPYRVSPTGSRVGMGASNVPNQQQNQQPMHANQHEYSGYAQNSGEPAMRSQRAPGRFRNRVDPHQEPESADLEMEMLDIPAFLRRQAD